MTKYKECHVCDGEGRYPINKDKDTIVCPECQGAGRIRNLKKKFNDILKKKIKE